MTFGLIVLWAKLLNKLIQFHDAKIEPSARCITVRSVFKKELKKYDPLHRTELPRSKVQAKRTRKTTQVALWVITIKNQESFACVVRADKVTRVQNADQTARTYECFVYSIVTITRSHDYKTRQTHFWGKLRFPQRYDFFFFSGLCFSSVDWLSGQTPIA